MWALKNVRRIFTSPVMPNKTIAEQPLGIGNTCLEHTVSKVPISVNFLWLPLLITDAAMIKVHNTMKKLPAGPDKDTVTRIVFYRSAEWFALPHGKRLNLLFAIFILFTSSMYILICCRQLSGWNTESTWKAVSCKRNQRNAFFALER